MEEPIVTMSTFVGDMLKFLWLAGISFTDISNLLSNFVEVSVSKPPGTKNFKDSYFHLIQISAHLRLFHDSKLGAEYHQNFLIQLILVDSL